MDNEGKMTARKVKNARMTAGASTLCVARQGYVAFFDLPPANKTEKQHGSSPVFCRRERKKRSGKEERKMERQGSCSLGKGFSALVYLSIFIFQNNK